MNLVAIPLWLRLWLAVQIIFFVVDPLLAPQRGSLMRALVWALIMLVIGRAMWKRSKAAWVVAVLLAIWSLITALPLLFAWTRGFDRAFAWFLWGFVVGLADLAILLSRQARDWVNEPTERKWTYADSL